MHAQSRVHTLTLLGPPGARGGWPLCSKALGRLRSQPSRPARLRCFVLFLSMVLPAWFLVSPSSIRAQLVRGRVLEAEGDRPIQLANLQLLDDRDQVLVEALSDSTGSFRIRAWEAGKYRLRASGLGYEPVTSELLELATGEEFVIEVRLAPDAIPLEPITVVSRSQSTLKEEALRGYYDRRDFGRRIGLGRFLDRGQIEEMGTKLTDVLRRVPGLRVIEDGMGNEKIVVSGNAFGTGCLTTGRRIAGGVVVQDPRVPYCTVSLYLDGQLIRSEDEIAPLPDIDQFVPLEWVEAIEVYRRPSETPAEFLGSAACGVVAIWTRRG